MALHDAVRDTIDGNMVLGWTKRVLERAEETLGAMGLVSRLPMTASGGFDRRDEHIQRRNMIAWNFHNPSNPLEQVGLLRFLDRVSPPLRQAPASTGTPSVARTPQASPEEEGKNGR